jgi:hypothetical protein
LVGTFQPLGRPLHIGTAQLIEVDFAILLAGVGKPNRRIATDCENLLQFIVLLRDFGLLGRTSENRVLQDDIVLGPFGEIRFSKPRSANGYTNHTSRYL